MKQEFNFRPKGVCPRMFHFTIEDGRIVDFSAEGGCNGNLKGIGALITGMPVDQVIERLNGIQCGFKTTSCPDQIAAALKEHTSE
ncbi:TIGR03905 family TSCPD domain-containing protein [Catenisphaera adipataccumulans]|jgi:uncharacterized protein (TIGR03905 family)|uniref:ribonucleoside-diphosphate reductase n=1 Tax=Catenisphaera adipataccumulans TaxID=700500 RepID=A0A7W8CYY7_9FIRM|nr:TIGR03905 family TSCPD domain-containing protein [Catenisphaera adipataccumulans]MBB5182867.1 uncharacterized protein (TIGR03905 family) [Catenisphaera adipataccumulans]